MKEKIRVRYAPSPTGHLHIGNARTALFNYLYARNKGGTFVVRVEDTDTKRNVRDGEASQLKYLKWLGIDWDESVDVGGPVGPYRQSERLEIYQQQTEQLLAAGRAYKCYCTEEELVAEREEQKARGENPAYSGKCRHLTVRQQGELEAAGRKPSIRFMIPLGKTYAFDDLIKGQVRFESDTFGDWVMMKKDGTPTYNYAVVIDDHLMEITHVLRGDDHISNTPKQLMVYEALDWQPPVYGHMTLIVNESHKKLSKRDETIIQFIEQYEELGYLPEALFNFIALLGWHPGGEEEIFSRAQFIERFDSKRLSKAPALFDQQKLAHINNQYMKRLSVEQVAEVAIPQLVKAGCLSEDIAAEEKAWATSLVALFKDYMSYGAEIVSLSELFFQDQPVFEEEAKKVLQGEQVPEVLTAFLKHIEALPNFIAEEIQPIMKAIQKETGHKGKALFMPVRSAIFGQVHGPDLMKSLELLGRKKVVERVHSIINPVH